MPHAPPQSLHQNPVIGQGQGPPSAIYCPSHKRAAKDTRPLSHYKAECEQKRLSSCCAMNESRKFHPSKNRIKLVAALCPATNRNVPRCLLPKTKTRLNKCRSGLPLAKKRDYLPPQLPWRRVGQQHCCQLKARATFDLLIY